MSEPRGSEDLRGCIEEQIKRAQPHCRHATHGQKLCAGCAAIAAERIAVARIAALESELAEAKARADRMIEPAFAANLARESMQRRAERDAAIKRVSAAERVLNAMESLTSQASYHRWRQMVEALRDALRGV